MNNFGRVLTTFPGIIPEIIFGTIWDPIDFLGTTSVGVIAWSSKETGGSIRGKISRGIPAIVVRKKSKFLKINLQKKILGQSVEELLKGPLKKSLIVFKHTALEKSLEEFSNGSLQEEKKWL